MAADLDQLTARELMTSNPLAIREDATDLEAMCRLADKGVSGLLVIDAAGHPVGVVTAADVLIHQRQHLAEGGPAEPRRSRCRSATS